MYEIKRLFLSKMMIFSICVSLIANGVVFCFEKVANEDLVREDEETLRIYQEEYIESYQKKYDGIIKNAQNVYKGLREEDRGTYKWENVDKTVEDFEIINEIKLSLDDEQAVSVYIEYNFSGYMLIICVLAVVLVMYNERKKGLWTLVHSTKAGRKKIATIRFGIVFLVAFISEILISIENYILCRVNYGSFGDLSRAAQCNSAFENLTYEFSMCEVLLIGSFIRVLAVGILGCIFWLIISNMKQQVIACFVYVVIVASEYLAYDKISALSSMKNIKYINVFSGVHSFEMIKQYLNLNIFGSAKGYLDTVLVVFIFVILICGILFLISGNRKPFQVKTSKGMRTFIPHCITVFHEIFKLIRGQKIWVVAIAFIVIVLNTTKSMEVMYDYRNLMYTKYMDSISGTVTEEKAEFLDSEKIIWEKKLSDAYKEIEQYESGEKPYSSHIVESLKRKIENYIECIDLVDELKAEAESLLKLKEDGHKACFVNKISYEMYIGKSGERENLLNMLIVITFVVISFAAVWSYDNQSDMKKIVRSTKKGRRFLVVSRFLVSMIFALLYIVFSFVMRYFQIKNTYGLTGLTADMRSLPMYREVGLSLSLGGVLALALFVRMIVVAFSILAIHYISSRSKNNIYAIVTNLMIFVLPSCLYLIGIDFMKYFSIIKLMEFTGFLI